MTDLASHAYYLIDGLLRPYTFLMLLTGLGLCLVWRRRRESRRVLLLVAAPFGCLTALSLPVVAYLALASLEWSYPPQDRRPPDAEAIVVLSGAVLARDVIRTHEMLGETSLYRCLEAVRAYKAGPPLPVVATGGTVLPDDKSLPCAVLMVEFMESAGVAAPDLRVEPRARTTHENAQETRALLAPRGVRKIVLVTDATHMWRSVLCFRRAGFEVTPWPSYHRATEFRPTLLALLPAPNAVADCLTVAHEWMGLVYYRLTGKI
jgi:uncharacterized SAM-binding protein YcdF (DUF218 family)